MHFYEQNHILAAGKIFADRQESQRELRPRATSPRRVALMPRWPPALPPHWPLPTITFWPMAEEKRERELGGETRERPKAHSEREREGCGTQREWVMLARRVGGEAETENGEVKSVLCWRSFASATVSWTPKPPTANYHILYSLEEFCVSYSVMDA
jgi:hypothetical protein